MDFILDFLDNGSVSAFLGALAAYLLVQFTDLRRVARDHRLIGELIKASKRLASDKLVAVERNYEALTAHNKVIGAPFMRFSIEEIKVLEGRVLDRLKTDEKISLDALCYTMIATDEILDEATSTANMIKELKRTGASSTQRGQLAKKLAADFEDVMANLRKLQTMMEWYVKGKYRKILGFKYHRDDFDQISGNQ